MAIILRIIGGFWVLHTFRPVLSIFIKLIQSRLDYTVGLSEGISTVMLVGGFGLALLKEWGRVVLRIGAIAYFILQAAQVLYQRNLTPGALAPLLYYGIFVVILSLPQAQSETRN